MAAWHGRAVRDQYSPAIRKYWIAQWPNQRRQCSAARGPQERVTQRHFVLKLLAAPQVHKPREENMARGSKLVQVRAMCCCKDRRRRHEGATVPVGLSVSKCYHQVFCNHHNVCLDGSCICQRQIIKPAVDRSAVPAELYGKDHHVLHAHLRLGGATW